MYCVNGVRFYRDGLTLSEAVRIAKDRGLAMVFREDSEHFVLLVHPNDMTSGDAWKATVRHMIPVVNYPGWYRRRLRKELGEYPE